MFSLSPFGQIVETFSENHQNWNSVVSFLGFCVSLVFGFFYEEGRSRIFQNGNCPVKCPETVLLDCRLLHLASLITNQQ